MANMNGLWFHHIDVLVIDFEYQGIGLGIRRAVDVRPLILRHGRELSVPRQQVVTVRKRSELWNEIDVISLYPADQVGDLFLFQEASVSTVLMRRVLLHVVDRVQGIV